MSIKPIDLQTLFVKMDDVSKQQALAQDKSAAQQAQAAKEQVAKELEQDNRVTEAGEDRETEAVKDEEERRGSGREKREGREEGGSDEDGAGREVLQVVDAAMAQIGRRS